MLIDVGDPLPIQTMQVKDSAGNLANAGAMTLTVTLPDGTTASPGPGFTNAVTGVYVPGTYITTQAGRHVVRWVGTGVNASAYTEAFDVRPALATGILSLADARAVCNQEDDSQDDELRVYIEATTDAIEGIVGPVGRRTVTEVVYPSSGVLLLGPAPVLSVTSITPYAGVALGAGTYTLLPSGIVIPATYGVGFYAARYDVVYEVGRVVIPASVHLAARKTLKHLWTDDQPQRGRAAGAGFGGEEDLAAQAFTFVTSYGVRALLDPYKRPPGVA